MKVYVICAHVEWDSYHQVIFVTVDKEEVERWFSEHNNTEEYDIQYHMHELPLKGI